MPGRTVDLAADRMTLLSELEDKELGCHKPEGLELWTMLHRFAVSRQGASLTLYGPRGVGKTRLVQDVFHRLQKDADLPGLAFVRLNGFVQTDDREAVRELCRQLAASVDELEAGGRGSYAELLEKVFSLGSLADVGIVVLLEEADLFTQHHNQSLLYSLLDATLVAGTRLAVLLSTSTPAFGDLLEKRSRSRLSQQRLVLKPPSLESAKGFLAELLTSSDCPQWSRQMRGILAEEGVERLVEEALSTSTQAGFVKHVGKLVLTHTAEGPAREDFYAAAEALNPDLDKDRLMDLSSLELALLLSIRAVQRDTEVPSFNFEQVFDEYRRFVNKRAAVTALPKQRPVVYKAYQRLAEVGLTAAVSGASDGQRPHQQCLLDVAGPALCQVVAQGQHPAPLQNFAAELASVPDIH